MATLEFTLEGTKVRADLTPDGWRSDSAGAAAYLEAAYPLVSSAAGDPLVRAFGAAARGEGAAVVEEPVPAELPAGAVP